VLGYLRKAKSRACFHEEWQIKQTAEDRSEKAFFLGRKNKKAPSAGRGDVFFGLSIWSTK
jgi:hypothetical protein